MNSPLSNLEGKRTTFTAKFSGINRTYGLKGIRYSVELTNMKDSNGNILSNYLCFNMPKAFNSVKVGDNIEFSGIVEKNIKKYNHIIAELYSLNQEFKITRITHMKKV